MAHLLLCWTVLLWTTFKSYTSLLITKQATLTPNITSQNGATITVLNANMNWDPAEWQLYDGATNEKFQLLLTLDTSWGFHQTENSKLMIEVNANTNTGNPGGNYHDLMVAFTQYPFNTYFTTLISMNPYGTDHKMYPYWTQTQPFPAFANGDVKSIVDGYVGPGWTRFLKASNNNQFVWWTPHISSNRYVIAPLTFVLENLPKDNYMLFTYTNPGTAERWCWYKTMSPNTAINIYFAADRYYDSVDISSITVTLNYTITDAPTYTPTITPTNTPTMPPTIYPTNTPTITPIINPTITPTIYPTLQPTYIPTINPTIIPSISPSINPSLSPSTMTNNPSYSPTNHPTDNPTKPQSVVDDDDDVSTTLINGDGEQIINGGDGDVNNVDLYLIIGSVSAVVIVIILSVIIILKKRRNKEIQNEQKLANIGQRDVVKQENIIMTQMVINPDVDIEDDGTYKVQSTEMIPVRTPKSDIESVILNGNDIDNNDYNDDNEEEEGDDNQDTEAMYDNITSIETVGNEMMTDKGDSNDDINGNIECRDEVNKWLRETVELQQYSDMFVKNGLDSLQLIAKLNDNEEALIDLGIELKGHRIIIMKYIKQLNVEGGNR